MTMFCTVGATTLHDNRLSNPAAAVPNDVCLYGVTIKNKESILASVMLKDNGCDVAVITRASIYVSLVLGGPSLRMRQAMVR